MNQEPTIQDGLARLCREFRLKTVREIARSMGRELHLVGGCLRDLLLGREVHEVDLAVDDDPFVVGRELARRLRGAFVVLDPGFGIARVVLKGPRGPLQYDLCRLKGRTITEDLSLRDLSLNALALELGAAVAQDPGRLLDPSGGRVDLERRTVRMCSAQAFEDDPLRMLRAFRIGAQLDFVIDPGTLRAMEGRIDSLDAVAAERVTEEFLKLLAVEGIRPWIERLATVGLLQRIFPEADASRGPVDFTDLDSLEAAIRDHEERAKGPWGLYLREPAVLGARQREIVKLAALCLKLGVAATRPLELTRLRLSARDADGLSKLVVGVAEAPWNTWKTPPDDATTYRFFRDCAPHGPGIVLIASAWSEGPVLDRLGALESTLEDRPAVVAPPRLVDGRELMADLGLSPGPRIGRLLEAIREAQASGSVRTRDEALSFARARMQGSD